MLRRVLVVVGLIVFLAAVGPTWAADSTQRVDAGAKLNAGDWPQWRGPNRDGLCLETGLLKSWPEEGPPLAWQSKGLGGGMASVAIAGGRIFTLGAIKGRTHLEALDQADGKQLWTAEVGGGSPNCTPTVDGQRVFALSRDGDFVCCEAATGKLVWRRNFPSDFGGKMMSGWGYSESPLVDGDRLICTPGAPEAVIIALDKSSGDVIWKSPAPAELGGKGERGKDGAGYSSIVISQAAGLKQYVQLTGRGIISVAASDGRVLWSYNRVANGTANIPTPIVSGDYVFCSTGYGTGAALLKIVKDGDGAAAEEVYFLKADAFQNHHGGMVLVGDYIYCGHGHNNGLPMCLEMKTGKSMWEKQRGPGSGSAAVLYADGNLYFRYEDGEMALIEANPKQYNLKGHFKLASIKGKSWPHPVIANGKLYLRDQDVLMVYNVASADQPDKGKPSAVPAKTSAREADPKPVALVPAVDPMAEIGKFIKEYPRFDELQNKLKTGGDARFYTMHLHHAKEPDLGPIGRQGGEAYRLIFMDGGARATHILRVQQTPRGAQLVVKDFDALNVYHGQPGELSEFAVPLSADQWQEFKGLVSKAGFWQLPTENKTVGLDGAYYLIEGVSPTKHHITTRFVDRPESYRALFDYLGRFRAPEKAERPLAAPGT